MKKAKKLILMAVVGLLLFMLSPFALAAEESYVFRLEVSSDSPNLNINLGEIITVNFYITNTGGAATRLMSMQNEICFDSEYFEFVANSIDVYKIDADTGFATTTDGKPVSASIL